ncbi:protein-tyrosine phosphatase-like protein [Phycomyces blakesleeanus]
MNSISWMIPLEALTYLSISPLPPNLDLNDLASFPSLVIEPTEPTAIWGNMALSSCPGKKVRLSGPVRGRAAINRDLDLDFERMASFNITAIVCCLDDNELDFLGASWPDYIQAAKTHHLEVIRLPMAEGGCPSTLQEVHKAIQCINKNIQHGQNVLAHCRGGVGRAGLFACCWLLENRLCLTAERAILYVRTRRSAKAIETMRQAEFIIHYARFVNQRAYQLPTTNLPLQMTHTEHTLSVPSLTDIANLERQIYENERLLLQTTYPIQLIQPNSE